MAAQKYKILHTIESSTPGGAETVMASLASGLNQNEFSSYCLLIHRDWLDQKLDELQVPYAVIPNNRSYDPKFVWSLFNLVKRENINLIHAHEFGMIVYGSFVARLAGIPMIGTIHGKNYYVDKKRRILFFRMALAMSSTIVAVSNDLKDFVVQKLNLPIHPKLITLYNGINLSKYDKFENKPELRREFGLSDNDLVALSVGSLFEVKGFKYLLAAAALIIDQLPTFHLVIAGDGDRTSLFEQAEQLGISENVHLIGFRDDVPQLLNMADLYVCSSLSEGLSLSILEAMAVGKPIVATDVGGNPELINEGRNGLLVPSENPTELADRILRLARDNTLAESFGNNAREKVYEQFSLEAMTNNYERLYRQFLG